MHYRWMDISRTQKWRQVRERFEKLRSDQIQLAREVQTEQEHLAEFDKRKTGGVPGMACNLHPERQHQEEVGPTRNSYSWRSSCSHAQNRASGTPGRMFGTSGVRRRGSCLPIL
jgi:hypothetical protein